MGFAKKKLFEFPKRKPDTEPDAQPQAPRTTEEPTPDPVVEAGNKLFDFGRNYAVTKAILTPDRFDLENVLLPFARQTAHEVYVPFDSSQGDDRDLIEGRESLRRRAQDRRDELDRIDPRLLQLKRDMPQHPGRRDYTYACAAGSLAIGAGLAMSLLPLFQAIPDAALAWGLALSIGLSFAVVIVVAIMALEQGGRK